MTARIYKPARTAMQSGHAKTKEWVLDYEPEQPREIEPLMGWTSSGDMRQQVQLRFDSQEEAIAYCERHGIAYQVFQSKPPVRRGISYADNFAFNRRDPSTHGRRATGCDCRLPISEGEARSPEAGTRQRCNERDH